MIQFTLIWGERDYLHVFILKINHATNKWNNNRLKVYKQCFIL